MYRVICCFLSLIIFSMAHSADDGLEAVEGKHQHKRASLARQANAVPKWGVGFYLLQNDPQIQEGHPLSGSVYVARFDAAIFNYVVNKRQAGVLNDNDILILLAPEFFSYPPAGSWDMLCNQLINSDVDMLMDHKQRVINEAVAIVRINPKTRALARQWNVVGAKFGPVVVAAVQHGSLDHKLKIKSLDTNLLPIQWVAKPPLDDVMLPAKQWEIIREFNVQTIRDKIREENYAEVIIAFDGGDFGTLKASGTSFAPTVHKLLNSGCDMLVDENTDERDSNELKPIREGYAVILKNGKTLNFFEELVADLSQEPTGSWSRFLLSALQNQLEGSPGSHIHYTAFEWDYLAPVIPV